MVWWKAWIDGSLVVSFGNKAGLQRKEVNKCHVDICWHNLILFCCWGHLPGSVSCIKNCYWTRWAVLSLLTQFMHNSLDDNSILLALCQWIYFSAWSVWLSVLPVCIMLTVDVSMDPKTKRLSQWIYLFCVGSLSSSFPFVRGEVLPATFSPPHLIVFSTLLCLLSSSSSLPPLLPSSHLS